jgi:hypothetical protein
MRVPRKIPELFFTWPLGDTVRDDQKIRVVCQVPEPAKLLEAQMSTKDVVTNEMTNLTKVEYHFDNFHRVYDLCVLRIEGVEDEDGAAVDPVRAKEKLPFYTRVNFGLDDQVHGVFQNDFGEWFNRRVARSRQEEVKKNVTASPAPATDSGPVNAPTGTPPSPSTAT